MIRIHPRRPVRAPPDIAGGRLNGQIGPVLGHNRIIEDHDSRNGVETGIFEPLHQCGWVEGREDRIGVDEELDAGVVVDGPFLHIDHDRIHIGGLRQIDDALDGRLIGQTRAGQIGRVDVLAFHRDRHRLRGRDDLILVARCPDLDIASSRHICQRERAIFCGACKVASGQESLHPRSARRRRR